MPEEILLVEHSDKIINLFPNGEMRLFKIGVKRITVVRIDQIFYAFDNHCPHSDFPLNEGVLNNQKQIVCPWHNYMFDLHTGNELEYRCRNLKLYKVQVNATGQLILILS
jgi:nitrite reductase/ring-hydroxylating ferredoxin subunit